jgi:hypothetical protein
MSVTRVHGEIVVDEATQLAAATTATTATPATRTARRNMRTGYVAALIAH